MPEQTPDLPVATVAAPARARPWYRLHRLPLVIGVVLLIWMIWLNTQELAIWESACYNELVVKSYSYEYVRGYPEPWFRREVAGWEIDGWGFLPDDDLSRNPTDSTALFINSGLLIDLAFLVVSVLATVAFCEFLYRVVPHAWLLLRGITSRPHSDESIDGAPDDPAWDEAKNR